MNIKRIIADRFIKDVSERPDDFEVGRFHLNDKKTGREYWIANKGYGFKIELPFEVEIGNTGAGFSYHGNRCYAAYKRLLAHKFEKMDKAS